MKVLILIPGENARGGITNYYTSLRKHLPDSIMYFKRGSRNWPQKANALIELARIVTDYLRFIYIILFKKISIVQTTTAFYRASILRDGVFILLAKLFRIKTIVFFRGWNDEYVHSLSGLSLKLFKLIYFRTDALIDLSENNVDYLKKLGYQNKIYLETTVVDETLTKDINIENLIDKRFERQIKSLLFLSRIEKAKGVYKLLNIYKELRDGNSDYQLIFAGDGTELENLKLKVVQEQIPDVIFKGFVHGDEKRELFKDASIFIFLSDFEGMPNAVLEAMAFGLPIITTNVGGIASVFKNKVNGYLINEYNCDDIVTKVRAIFNDYKLYSFFSKKNIIDAHKKVMSDVVAKRMMSIFLEISRVK